MNHLEGRLIGVLNSEVRLIISPTRSLLGKVVEFAGLGQALHINTLTFPSEKLTEHSNRAT
jgi:hypothetical protein